jgi:hypothetical protein
LLTERIKSHGPYHRDTVATHHCLGEVLTDLHDFAGAAAELDEVIEGMRRLVGPRHPDTLRRRYERACLDERMGHHRQAAEALTEILDDQLTILGDSHELVTETRAALTRLTSNPATRPRPDRRPRS